MEGSVFFFLFSTFAVALILCSAKGHVTWKVELGEVNLFGLKGKKALEEPCHWLELSVGFYQVYRARNFSEVHSERIRAMKREIPIRL